MADSDRSLVLVFNGEIYNHEALRRELETVGHSFHSDHSDSETIVEGYRRWGRDVVDHLDGMFAFVIYDRDRGRLFFARDRFGKKPLFYWAHDGGLIFGSEISSLLNHPNLALRISPDAVIRYLAVGHLPAPGTFFEGVFKLPAGHTMEYGIKSHDITVRRYWKYRIRLGEEPPGTAEDWAEELVHLLRAAVKRRLNADVPLGILSSGGIDSASIVAFAQQEDLSCQIQTFTAGFDEATFDERQYARLVADQFGARHHELVVSADDAKRTLAPLLSKMDEPIADPSLVPTHIICRFAREHVTVALSGDGGDELFAGYDPYKALRWAAAYRAVIPNFFRGVLSSLSERLPISSRNMGWDYKLRQALRGVEHPASLWNPVWLAPASISEIEQLTGRRLDAGELFSGERQLWEDCESENLIDRTLEYYANTYLERLLTKMDRASMLCSLEVRSPFLDKDLVEFALRLPAHVKFRRGSGKWLLKKALSSILPRPILSRPKKGFGMPHLWLKTMEKPNAIAAESLGLKGDRLVEMWRANREGERDHRGVLGAWKTLELSLAPRALGQ